MIPNLSKQQIYDTAAALAKRLDAVLQETADYKAWLDSVTDATLLAAPFNCVQGDLDILRSGCSDLNQLRTIYQGSVNLLLAKDFRTFSKQFYAYSSHL